MAGLTVSPENTDDLALDGVTLATGPTALGKRAVAGTSATVASGDNNAAQEVGTHVDGATPSATVPYVGIAAVADDTAPASTTEGKVGYIRMSLARALHSVHVADAAAVTSVASQDTNITLLAANANRIGFTIHNSDAGPLYVKFGATATATTSYTVKIPPDGFYECGAPVYRGIVDGIWTSSSTGAAQITELT